MVMSSLSIGEMSNVQENNAASTNGQSKTNNKQEVKVKKSESAVQGVRDDVIMNVYRDDSGTFRMPNINNSKKANKASKSVNAFFDKHHFTDREKYLFYMAGRKAAAAHLGDEEFPLFEISLMSYICRDRNVSKSDFGKQMEAFLDYQIGIFEVMEPNCEMTTSCGCPHCAALNDSTEQSDCADVVHRLRELASEERLLVCNTDSRIIYSGAEILNVCMNGPAVQIMLTDNPDASEHDQYRANNNAA